MLAPSSVTRDRDFAAHLNEHVDVVRIGVGLTINDRALYDLRFGHVQEMAKYLSALVSLCEGI